MSEENEDENESETESSGLSPNAKRLSPEQWDEIERSFRMGEETVSGLSARYGVSTSTVSKRFKARNIQHGMDKPDPAKQAVAQATAIAAAALAQPKKTFAERREENIEKTKNTSYEIHNAIQIMIGNMLRDIAGPAKVSPQTKIADIKALNLMAKTNELARIGKYVLLDIMPDPDAVEMPTIVIDDIADEEIERLSRLHADEESDEILPEQEIEIEGDESS